MRYALCAIQLYKTKSRILTYHSVKFSTTGFTHGFYGHKKETDSECPNPSLPNPLFLYFLSQGQTPNQKIAEKCIERNNGNVKKKTEKENIKQG